MRKISPGQERIAEALATAAGEMNLDLSWISWEESTRGSGPPELALVFRTNQRGHKIVIREDQLSLFEAGDPKVYSDILARVREELEVIKRSVSTDSQVDPPRSTEP